MPPRKRYLSRSRIGWSEEQLDQLRFGHDMFGDAFGELGCPPDRRDGRPFDEESAKQAWDELGEGITADWLAERPGTRPWGWWRWSAPEPRRVVAGREHPESGYPPWLPGCERQFYFGRPTPIHPKDTAQYEDEVDYLDRLGLLTEDERHGQGVANITNAEE